VKPYKDPPREQKIWTLTNEALGFEIQFIGRVVVERVEDEPLLLGIPWGYSRGRA